MNNSKIGSRKKSSAIFLAIVLVAGTITAISPSSFMTIGASAQAQSYYGGMDNSYDDKKSYGMDDSYGYSDYRDDKDKKYDSYGPPEYEMDNNYAPDYPSYEKDDRDKSQKDSSDIINKIKCNTNNINVNGDITGDVNLGNKGQAIEEGYLGAYSSNDDGYGGDDGYYNDGYNNKKDKGIDCIINNNNNNTNIGGGGNQTTPPKATLNVTKLVACNYFVGIDDPCPQLTDLITEDQFDIEVTNDNPVPSQFPGSESGSIVTLGSGNYIVSETIDDSVDTDLNNLRMQFPGYSITGPQILFMGDCTDVNPNNLESTEATGTIGAGESQTCNIINAFQASQGGGG